MILSLGSHNVNLNVCKSLQLHKYGGLQLLRCKKLQYKGIKECAQNWTIVRIFDIMKKLEYTNQPDEL